MIRVLAFVIAMAASCSLAYAQAQGPSRQALEDLIRRDHVEQAFGIYSNGDMFAIAHPPSGLVCVGMPDTLQLAYSPSANFVSASCTTTFALPARDGAAAGDMQIFTRVLGGASPQVRQIFGPERLLELYDSSQQGFVEIAAKEIDGRPWTGAHIEVGGNDSPEHPPYEIRRFQGVLDGHDVYLRIAWARIGDWVFSQKIEVPLERQVEAETLGSLDFYNTLLIAHRLQSAVPAPAAPPAAP